MSLEWKSPPTPKATGGSSDHERVAKVLRSRPGEWALIMTGVAPGHVSAIKKGQKAAYRPAGSFEAVQRASETVKGKIDVYARYIGES